MSGHNIPLIIMMLVSIALLFLAMILSAVASTSANRTCIDKHEVAYKNSMASAIIAGLAVLTISIALVLYIFRAPVSLAAKDLTGYAAAAVAKHTDAIQRHARAVDALKNQ